ncbi:glycosyl transferase family 2 [Methylocella silvestris BL2]|uniref:Glucans biosynthesis glucosyltransferase H n=1 Tax=Methylocella silvestris (strain DSM 15510 / CIP 108128 / LMG 27833 / NCIMB 13906 / BL2) TaxID=395965 RepID=B8EP94_METSB|nr:glycosyl transferase family 2 [Methylocella silvestris BL2]
MTETDPALRRPPPRDFASEGASVFPAMPAEAPLDMPTQSLSRFDPSTRRKNVLRHPWLGVLFARLFVFGGGLALTCYGAYEMYEVVAVGGVTLLEWALLILFVANFSWIALAFSSGLAGLLWLMFFAPRAPALPAVLHERTAIVMPIYNEAPARIFAALEAMIEDVAASGLGQSFDWFFLSDTTNPEIFLAEERAFIDLRQRVGGAARVYYRHRPKNLNRKAGNIEDFVTRWGGRYPHMVVLDADSLMTGPAIVTLAAAMESDLDAGIIQTLPLIINRNTLFARVQQFAARIYGPVIAAGVSVWMGREGNYWGHNAIIRTRAFAAHCGLPSLPGRPPFGGHILSHDFVEAALILRAGFSVYMLPTLGGSFEESPPSLIDLSARDRRWCQGNLQHLRVLPARGFKIASRQHFITGIMAYVSSPLWMAQLFVGIILVIQASYIRPEYFSREFTLFPTWPRFDAERSLNLFALTMAILLTPKLFGLLLALFQGRTRRGCGGAIRLILSALFEIVMSALLAPIMMLIQAGHVMHFAFGFDTGWDPQRRDDGSIAFGAIVRRHRSHVAMGVVTLIAGFMIAPSLVAWMSPTIIGLILAIVISWSTGLLNVGMAFRRAGLLLTPEEQSKPPIVARANELARQFGHEAPQDDAGEAAFPEDPKFWALHLAWLPAQKRASGDISAEWALANAKLENAETMDEAIAWLKPKERMALLNDRTLIARLLQLPRKSTAPEPLSSVG